MEVELLVIPECPGAEQACELLGTALTDVGLPDVTFTVTIIDTEEAARARGFAGSPAFVVDGTDLFVDEGRHGSVACRIYPTPDGPRNVPALRDLRTALRRRTRQPEHPPTLSAAEHHPGQAGYGRIAWLLLHNSWTDLVSHDGAGTAGAR